MIYNAFLLKCGSIYINQVKYFQMQGLKIFTNNKTGTNTIITIYFYNC